MQFANSRNSRLRHRTVFQLISFGDEAAEQFGRIKQALAIDGTPIGPMDLLIAATAISIGARLVTNNREESRRVKSLKLADWTIS